MISAPSQQTQFTIRSIRMSLAAIVLGTFVAIKSTAVAACVRMAAPPNDQRHRIGCQQRDD